MNYAVVGVSTGTVYRECQYRSECFKWMNSKFAKRYQRESGSLGMSVHLTYPEAMMVVHL
ncbi:hypothetical protein ACFQ41_05175 [Lacticaseibacillus suilingensis]|uniref:Uncharacterized protein n=1 Tax=Lacticaseibacillus suilingensis TaxID=2799577 RepID=A0ABW4BHY3_9LACO|nr:hypothetical protein [Lacticaseibacillus suilingensis]